MVGFLGFGVLRKPCLGESVEGRPGVNTSAATEPEPGHAAVGVGNAALCSGCDGRSQPIRSQKFPEQFTIARIGLLKRYFTKHNSNFAQVMDYGH